ncbi:MAG TPA: endo-1,4-beta-xylanase [Pirellulales bacterium]|nr:endo-1,4-beta-xylanase [Pirellulales bacterium]
MSCRRGLVLRFVLLVILVAITSVAGVPLRAGTPTLKDAYRNDFLIGVALGGTLPDDYSKAELAAIKAHFNAVTPENCMKPEEIHPKEKIWDFEQPDALVKFAEENQMQIFGHTLVWHNQTPGWFFWDHGKPASREMLLERLKTHIDTVMGRYRGKIRGWDVVNEAIAEGGKDDLRQTKWRDGIGDDYIVRAYKFAHEADPQADLQYNDYGIESQPKLGKALRLIKSLQDAGVPVAAVGIQGHWQLDHVPYDNLEKAIDEFSKLGVKVMITELDMDTAPRQAGADVAHHEEGSAPPAEATPAAADILQRQAEQYAKLFALFDKHKDVITRVTFWGLDDGRSWLNYWPKPRIDHPLLFDRQCQPKPALKAIIDVVAKPTE